MQESLSHSMSHRKYGLRRLGLKRDIMPFSSPKSVVLIQCFMGIILVLHFFMIILGALAFDFSRFGKLGDALYFYSEASGTNSQFAFFSPGISSQIRVRFTVKRGQKPPETFEMLNHEHREVNLRLGDISDQFLSIADAEEQVARKLQRLLAASLAGNILGRNPDAQSVTVSIEEFIPRSLYEKHEGPPPVWRQVYSIEFSRNTRGAVP